MGKNKFYFIALFLIILFGVYFRFYNLPGLVWSMEGYDESRDMLVAKHIVDFGETVTRGPFAAGGFNILKNSPFYYYFIATLWFFSRSPLGVMFLWGGLMVLMIPLAYRIGHLLWDRWMGLVFALIIAVHPNLIHISKQIGQPNIMPLWILIVMWNLLRKKSLNILDLGLNIFIIFLGLHIHYGSLIVVPVLYIWLLYIWFKQFRGHYTYETIFVPVLLTCIALLLWVFSTYAFVPFDQLIFFQINGVEKSIEHASIGLVVGELLMLVVPGVPIKYSALVFIGVAFFILIGHKMHKSNKLLHNNIFWIGLSVIIPIFFYSFYHGRVHASYMFSLLPICLLLIGVAVRILFHFHLVVGLPILIIGVYFFIRQAFPMEAHPYVESIYIKNSDVAQAIYVDYTQDIDSSDMSTPSFVLATLSTAPYLVYDGWGTGSTWYWLEKYFNKKLVTLTDGVVNFIPIISNPNYFYVICDHRNDGSENASICLTRFISARNYISAEYVQIYTSSTYSVWRFSINNLDMRTQYNVAYDELLYLDK